MGSPHALVLPYPAQGHVIPLMELSHCLVDHGFNITFVNTKFNHDRVVAAMSIDDGDLNKIRLVYVPDGLDPEETRNDLGRLTDGLQKTMPIFLEELINKSNETSDDKITCIIVDQNMAWALNIAKRMDLRSAIFWPAAAALLAIILSVPKLIGDGILDADGKIYIKKFTTFNHEQVLRNFILSCRPSKESKTFQLSQDMPLMETTNLAWNYIGGDRRTQQIIFNYMLNNKRATEMADFIFCNSFQEIELPTFTYNPKLLPVGPLLTGQRLGKPVGHFWSKDATCMAWLDKQPANSVIYVAFGSFTIFEKHQFQELALGLEMSGLSFLWVVRPDLTDGTSDAYPDGYIDRVARRGRMVGWCPQQKVLAHSSIACFISHCGWNSTMEGVRNGVSFLCWPYFADQFLNQSYVCDIWRIGLKVIPDENGIETGQHISSRLAELLADGEMRMRAQVLQEMASRNINKGGSSYKNLNSFIEAMKSSK